MYKSVISKSGLIVSCIWLFGCGTQKQFQAIADNFVNPRDPAKSWNIKGLAARDDYAVTEEALPNGRKKITLFQSGSGCKVVFYFDDNDHATNYEYLSDPSRCRYRSRQLM